MSTLEDYARVTGSAVIDQLRQLSEPLRGRRIVHVNSTRVGGGVAEILAKLVPLTRELGVDASWEVIEGEDAFYRCTKALHNGLQGERVSLTDAMQVAYHDTVAANAEPLREQLADADVVFIHDPQPAGLLQHFPQRRGRWIWRCHIDASRPHRPVWRFLQPMVEGYDASVFSLPGFARGLGHPEYIVPPSIDPLSEKNRDLSDGEVSAVREAHGLDRDRPLIAQVSRYDRFKDPVGVIGAWRLARRHVPDLQLVLAGGSADDDPEGEAVLEEVREAAADDPDVHVLLLPPDSHARINALQRAADIVLQKSTREGFGLTVAEAMWKGRPVIGGATGGIRLQVVNYHTGFLVHSPEGAALRIRYLLHQPEQRLAMGITAREFVRENFLLTRQLREYLTLCVALLHGAGERINL